MDGRAKDSPRRRSSTVQKDPGSKRKSRRSISDTRPPVIRALNAYDYDQEPPPAGHLVKSISENTLNRASSLSDVMRRQASRGGSMSALPHEVMLEMILKLNSADAAADWRDLARQYEMTEEDIEELGTRETQGPASVLLHRMMRAGVTVNSLVSFLKNVNRGDVVEVLSKAGIWSWEEDNPTDLKSSRIPISPTENYSSLVKSPPCILPRSESCSTGLRLHVTPPQSPTVAPRKAVAATLRGAVIPPSSPLARSRSMFNGFPRLEQSPRSPRSLGFFPSDRVSKAHDVDARRVSSLPRGARLVGESPVIEKLALVIGNADYSLDELKLLTPVEDAVAISQKLKNCGWRVKCRQNVPLSVMKKDLQSFCASCTKMRHAAAVVFYAGHAVQINGENYALPLDIRSVHSPVYVKQYGVNLSSLLRSLQSVLMCVVVVSASYNIPSWRGLTGLVVSNVPSNCCLALSCPPGSTQENVKGTVPGCSPYVGRLVQALEEQSDLQLENLLNAAESSGSDLCHFFNSRSLLKNFTFQSTYRMDPRRSEMQYALVIGNSEFEVGCADELVDMKQLAEFLRGKSWKVTTEKNVSAVQLIHVVHNFLYQAEIQDNDDCTVMVFFIGRCLQTDDTIVYIQDSKIGSPTTLPNFESTVTVQDIISLMEEAVAGPKVLTVGGTWNVDMECLEQSSFDMFPCHNMLVSLFSSESGVMRFVPDLIEHWTIHPDSSLLSTFESVLPCSNWSCLFKA